VFLSIIIGLAAGWISAKMSKGEDSIFWGNVTVGVMGAIAGSFLMRVFVTGLPGTFAEIIASVIGSVAALAILKLIAHKNMAR